MTENFWGWGFSSVVGQLCRMWRTVDLLPCSTKILCVSLVCWTMVSWDFFHFINLSSVRFSCVNSYYSSDFGRVELWFLQICSRSVPHSLARLFRELPKCTLVFLMLSRRCLGTSDLFILCFSNGRWLFLFFNPTFHLEGCLTKKHTLYIFKVCNLHFSSTYVW